MFQRTVNNTISYELTMGHSYPENECKPRGQGSTGFRLKVMSSQAPQVGRHWSLVLRPEHSFIKEVLTNGNLIRTLRCE